VSDLLEIRDLVIQYGKRAILDRVSLRAGRSERIAILGSSGSGKTSLLRAINGFTQITSGTLVVNGVDVSKARGKALRQLRSHIGFVSQRHDLIDALSVHQNVMAGALGRWSGLHALRFLLWPHREELEVAREALHHVGLEQKLRVRTSTLSGGEHQRVAIARALVQKPGLLLADEPVASLDPKTSEQILSLLSKLAEETHTTLICSLHQPELAEQYFNRIVSIHQGQLTETTPASLLWGANL
jgi:phosphonate transport system ATP-binding protein